MLPAPELDPVHRQRLARAVEAAKAGAEIRFRINTGEPSTVSWWDVAKPRVQHVILNGWGLLEPWQALVESEFNKQVEGK